MGHVVTFIVVSLAATTVSLGRAVPEIDGSPKDTGRLSAQIGAATGLTLRPDTSVWLVGTGKKGLPAAVFWQEILFLATKDSTKLADLYRAEVRISPNNETFTLRNLRNLTDSSAGDEYQLAVSPPYAAVATRAIGQVRSLTVFDFRGRPIPENEEWTPVTRFLTRLTDILETGHLNGVGRTTIRFAKPPRSVTLSFVRDSDSERIAVGWTDRQSSDHVTEIDLSGGHTDDEELLITADVRLPKRPILWLVDTVRSLPWIGPGPIEWAEGRFFAMRDAYRRSKYKLIGDESTDVGVDTPVPDSEPEILSVPPGLEVGSLKSALSWPPPKIEPPVFKRMARGEGSWHPAAPEFLRTLTNAPPAIYRTYTRPDLARPYVRVHLIAMDMRQLELHMVAGHEDPKPTTGSMGTGRIPRRPELLSRLVVAFNGAFKTEHGAYGMMVEGDVLLPPQDGAATVASLDDGRTVMGSWPKNTKTPKEMVSLRQNMDPLVEDGVVNPRRRYLWGFTLDEDIRNMNTIRSGICMTEPGALIYAWGEDLTAKTLGIAMNAAGCVYGIHLDMNPFHTSYIFYRFADEVADGERPTFEAKLALDDMRFSPNRYINGAPKDFFFLTLKDPALGPDWSADGLAQPTPAFLPAVFRRKSGDCRLVAIDLTRANAEIAPGQVPSDLAPGVLKSSHRRSPDLLVDLQLGRWSSNRGQLVRGTVVAALATERPTLGASQSGALSLGMWPLNSSEINGIEHAVQSSWLIPGTPPTQEISAVGLLGNDWLILGQGPGIELAAAMKEQGVKRALAFPVHESDDTIAVRGENGMMNLKGKPIKTRDTVSTALRLLARPRPLGMSRLEVVLDKGESKKTEKHSEQ